MAITQKNHKNQRVFVNWKEWRFKDWLVVLIWISVLLGGGGLIAFARCGKRVMDVWQAPPRIVKLEIRQDKSEKYVDVNYKNIQKICNALDVEPDSVQKSIFDNH